MQEISETLAGFGILAGTMYAGKAFAFYMLGKSKFASVREMYRFDWNFLLPIPYPIYKTKNSE